ncbi:MAG TPA: hypothetical protein H9669_02760 [Firmicutes bacterium]|nr:hypothetical protein [Bacillota bacterium]
MMENLDSLRFWVQIMLYAISVGIIYGSIRTQMKYLEKKVDMHNNAVERLYKAEKKLDVIEEKQKVANHRIDDLEHIHQEE